jgi:hypothetical protein
MSSSARTTAVSAAPNWMSSRRDVQLEIARGGRAYAALPYGARQVTCSQRRMMLLIPAPGDGGRARCDNPTVSRTTPRLVEAERPVNGSEPHSEIPSSCSRA